MSKPLIAIALLTACAPISNMRPAGELLQRDRSAEVGAALTALGPRPYVQESWQYVGQLWATAVLSHSLELTGMGMFDDQAAAGGAALRWTPLKFEPLYAGTELEAGFAWAAISVPISLHAAAPLWLYGSPRLGTFGVHLTPALPLGLSVETLPGLVVRGEWQVSWEQFLAYQRRRHVGGGAASPW